MQLEDTCSNSSNYRLNEGISIAKHTQYLRHSDWFLCENKSYLYYALLKNPKGIILTQSVYDEFKENINCPYIICDDPCKTWAEYCLLAYPGCPKFTVGVTGTNGKTSVSYIAYELLNALGAQCGYIGTLGVFPDVGIKSSLTTPDAAELHQILQKFQEKGITHVVVETSSSGLERKRVASLRLDVAAFTSFSHDHLDIHSSMESYWNAKMSIVDLLKNKKNFFVHSDLESAIKEEVDEYVVYNKENKYKNSSFVGFMHDNLQAACAICESAGFTESEIQSVLKDMKNNVPGRLEFVSYSPKVIVDYAHTPDGLEKLLKVFDGEKRLLIFGCGGDRDCSKREMMGQIANDNAEFVIVTDDNPRMEDPSSIREAILKTCPKGIEIGAREDAIRFGIKKSLHEGYVCIIAGKGHETYQIYKEKVNEFSDIECVKKVLTN